jgi:predicted transcriptional regulator
MDGTSRAETLIDCFRTLFAQERANKISISQLEYQELLALSRAAVSHRSGRYARLKVGGSQKRTVLKLQRFRF